MRPLAPVPVRVPVPETGETVLAIAASHPVRALVRAVMLLVVADSAAALRDQPAVEEVIAWAAVGSAAEDAAVAEAAAAEVAADN